MKATEIYGLDNLIQLLECCDNQLRKDLTRNAGGTITGKKNKVFAVMKSLAVREKNTIVARMMLHNMKQGRNEPICVDGDRLQGQASRTGQCV